MALRKQHTRRRHLTLKRFLKDRYLSILGVIILVTAISSFYIYQRIWARNLMTEIDTLQSQTDLAREHLSGLESRWMAASSIAGIEERLEDRKLSLRPTQPAQHLALYPERLLDHSRYAGLLQALDKLKSNMPLLSPNEAEAQQLFEDQ